MNKKKLVIYILLSASIMLILVRVELILAFHTVNVAYIDPTTSDAGQTKWYSMGIENEWGYGRQSIEKVVLSLDSGWEALDVDAPSGWTGTTNTYTDEYTYETFRWRSRIDPGETRYGFDWQATAPNTAGDYTMTVTTTDTYNYEDTDTFTITVLAVSEFPLGLGAIFALSLFVYIFLREI